MKIIIHKSSQIEPDSASQPVVTNTLNGAMAVISQVAQNSSQGVSFIGAGGYDGAHFSIPSSSQLHIGHGQL